MEGIILQGTVQGFLMGAMYALVALSLTLIYDVNGVLNFAHGDLLALAMYIAYVLQQSFAIDPYVAAPFIGVAFALLSVPLFRWLIRPVVRSGMLPAAQLMLGLLFVLQNFLLMTFSGQLLSVPTFLSDSIVVIGPVAMPMPLVVGAAAAGTIALALYLVIMRTDFGRSVRAIVQNRDAAALMGISISQVETGAFAIGIGLLGLIGPLLVSEITLAPTMGLDLTLLALIVMVVGGVRSFHGAVIAGLGIGVVESIGSLQWGGQIGAMIPYTLLVFVLLLRPRGLFGRQ
jgi:branched-chain amino acid transport system permease protein